MLLEIGPLIVDRLKAKVKGVEAANVLTTEDLVGVKESAQPAPALHVVHGGYAPKEGVGGDVTWDEIWLVVVVVKHVAQKDRAAKKMIAAAPLLREVLEALSGWRALLPDNSRSSLTAVPGPKPAPGNTHAYYPLAFSAMVHTTGCQEEY